MIKNQSYFHLITMIDIEIFHITKEDKKEINPYLNYLKRKNNYTLSVLIDNYHFDYDLSLISKDLQSKINLIAFEKSFEAQAIQILKNLPVDIKKGNFYLKGTSILLKKRNGRLTCPLLTSTWYLSRLGVLEIPKDSIVKDKKIPTEILNILEDCYRENEIKVIEIIKRIDESLLRKISYVFYDKEGVLSEGL